MVFDPTALQIEDLRDKFTGVRAQLQSRHPEWNAERDARLAIFSRCAHVLHSAFLFTILHRHVLSHRDFWTSNFNNVPGDGDLRLALRESDVFVFGGLFHFTFSSVEDAFRLYVRALDPEACDQGAGEFYNIKTWLLTTVNRRDLEAYFDLLRLVRNTIHNNGTYLDRRGRNQTVVWQGVTYEFEHGKAPRFVQWNFLLAQFAQLPDHLSALVEASPLREVGFINDPVILTS